MKAISHKPVPGVGRGKLTFSRFRSSCFRRAALLVTKNWSNDCNAACFVILGTERGELDCGTEGGATKENIGKYDPYPLLIASRREDVEVSD